MTAPGDEERPSQSFPSLTSSAGAAALAERWQIFPAARKARGAAALSFTRSVYCPIIGAADLQCSNAAAAAPLPFFSLFPLSRAEMERTARCSFRSRPPNHSRRRFTRRRRRRCQMSDSEQSASGEGGRDVNLEGEGRSRSLGERASERGGHLFRQRGARAARVMGLLRVLLHHSSLPSFLPGHPHSLHRRMKSCLRSAHSLTRGIRTIPEVEPRHGGEQSLQSSVFGNLQSEARRKSLDLLMSDKNFMDILGS